MCFLKGELSKMIGLCKWLYQRGFDYLWVSKVCVFSMCVLAYILVEREIRVGVIGEGWGSLSQHREIGKIEILIPSVFPPCS